MGGLLSGLFSSKTTTKSKLSPAEQALIRQRTGVESALTGDILSLLGFTKTPPAQTNVRQLLKVDRGGVPHFTNSVKKTAPENAFTKTGGGIQEQLAQIFQLSDAEKNLPGVVEKSGSSLAQILRDNLGQLTGKLDTSGFTNPLFQQFNEEVLPGIRSKALQLGVPSGSREGEVTNQAVGRFGGAVGDALGRAELGRRSIASNSLASLLPQIFGFETGGARAAADTAGLGRALEEKRISTPLDILLSVLQGTPRPSFAPPTTTTRGRKAPIDIALDIGTAVAKAKGLGGFAPTG